MKVLIVDDSALARSIIAKILEPPELGMEIVGQASNGQKAIQMVEDTKPDIIIMDINMPIMDGLEASKHIMATHPTPILIFSNELDAQLSFRALETGAVDVLKKPDLDQINNPEFYTTFIDLLKTISKKASLNAAMKAAKTMESYEHQELHVEPGHASLYELVVIGASTGGPAAVQNILSQLPGNFPVGIALVQHLETGFDEGYAKWLDSYTALHVRIAKDQDRPTPGEVLIAPVDKHLVSKVNRLYLDDGERILNQKPAVDALFKSAAQLYKKHVIGVLLTGMGKDGANGCVHIKQQGGITLIQDEASSAIFGMPKAAIEAGGATHVLPLQDIPVKLMELVGVGS